MLNRLLTFGLIVLLCITISGKNANAHAQESVKIMFSRGIGTGPLEISTMGLDGSDATKIIDARVGCVQFVPAPDGTKLACTNLGSSISALLAGPKVTRTPDPQAMKAGLYVLKLDGSDVQLLAEGLVFNPSWSVDGKLIVFAMQKGTKTSLYYIEVETKKVTPIPLENMFTQVAAWHPDGTSIVFAGNPLDSSGTYGALYTVKGDGSDLKQLTRFDNPNGTFTDDAPTYSPDGKQVLFASSRQSEPGNRGIYVINADGSGEKMLLSAKQVKGFNYLPQWSPDGKQILFSNFNDHSIYVMDASGSGVKKIGDGYTGRWLLVK